MIFFKIQQKTATLEESYCDVGSLAGDIALPETIKASGDSTGLHVGRTGNKNNIEESN